MGEYVQIYCMLAKFYNLEEGENDNKRGRRSRHGTNKQKYFMFLLYSCRVRDIKGILRRPNDEVEQKASSVNKLKRFLLH